MNAEFNFRQQLLNSSDSWALKIPKNTAWETSQKTFLEKSAKTSDGYTNPKAAVTLLQGGRSAGRIPDDANEDPGKCCKRIEIYEKEEQYLRIVETLIVIYHTFE